MKENLIRKRREAQECFSKSFILLQVCDNMFELVYLKFCE